MQFILLWCSLMLSYFIGMKDILYFSIDHLVYSGDDCYTHISLMLTSSIAHDRAPDCLGKSTIVPIPKGRNANLSDRTNFRGISLNPVFGKIFDNIVLERYSGELMSSELQFGFKACSSTNVCSMALKETIASS